MVWKTHLILYFESENDCSIADIVKRVEDLGFRSGLGPVYFELEWKTEPTKEQIFELGDKLKKALKGTGTIFNLDTHD